MARLLIPRSAIENSFRAETALTSNDEQNISRWYSLYAGTPAWATEEVRPLGLPKAIAAEFARVVCAEIDVSIDGGARAEYLQEQIRRYLSTAQRGLEAGVALGGLALKPYLSGDNIFIDATSLTGFTPMSFDNGGMCVAGVFRSAPVKHEGKYYVKLEYHDYKSGKYTIRNKAFTSNSDGICNTEVALATVPEWAELLPEVVISNVERPLFGYFSPVGGSGACAESIFAGATEDLIRQADEQWAKILYEFESAERKIIVTTEATSDILGHTGREHNPISDDRLFAALPYDSENFFKEFSPALRHAGFYEGLQAILRRIEFNVGLAYGDLSDPSTVEKTATEVVAAKNRKYNTVHSIEAAYKDSLESAIYGMDVYATLYGLAPQGEYTAYIDFDDSVLTDNDALRERDRQDVRDGLLQKYEYRMKWYGEDEETAKAVIAEMERGAAIDLFGGA